MKIAQSDTAITNYRFHVLPNLAGSCYTAIMDVMRPGCDYTIGELAHLTGMEKSSISARRRELLDGMKIEMGHNRECSISGITCQTVKLHGGGK